MSGGRRCLQPAHRAAGAWVVRQREGNQSAFNGGRWQPSAYSEVVCLECRSVWRTKAGYVSSLRDEADELEMRRQK